MKECKESKKESRTKKGRGEKEGRDEEIRKEGKQVRKESMHDLTNQRIKMFPSQ